MNEFNVALFDAALFRVGLFGSFGLGPYFPSNPSDLSTAPEMDRTFAAREESRKEEA